MGNAQSSEASTSLRGATTARLAKMLAKEHPAFEVYAERLYHGDNFLSFIDGDFILSLDLDYSETDRMAFQSLLDTLDVQPVFLRKSIENVVRRTIAQEYAMEQGNTMVPYPPVEMTHSPTNHPDGKQEHQDSSESKTPEHQTKRKSWADMEDEKDDDEEDPSKPVAAETPSISFERPTTNSKEVKVQTSSTFLSAKATPWDTPATRTDEGKPKKTFAEVVGNKISTSPTVVVHLFHTFSSSIKNRIGAVTIETTKGNAIGKLQLDEITLEAVKGDDWARFVTTNATMQGKDKSASDAIASLLRLLGQYQQSAYGRFRDPKEGTTGIVVISYKQPMSIPQGSLVCRFETDMRQVEDCPLEPLLFPKKWVRGSTLLHKLEIAERAESKSPTSSSNSPKPSSLQAAMARSPSKTKYSTPPVGSYRSLASPTSVMNPPFSKTTEADSQKMKLHIEKFRNDLNESLVEAFAEDGISTNDPAEWLEARDIWNSHNIVDFRSLSVNQKQAFVDEVFLAVDFFNSLFDKTLVVHRGTSNLRALVTLTIYRDAACKAKWRRSKRTICRYWLQSRCTKGAKCTFAHGEHELTV